MGRGKWIDKLNRALAQIDPPFTQWQNDRAMEEPEALKSKIGEAAADYSDFP